MNSYIVIVILLLLFDLFFEVVSLQALRENMLLEEQVLIFYYRFCIMLRLTFMWRLW